MSASDRLRDTAAQALEALERLAAEDPARQAFGLTLVADDLRAALTAPAAIVAWHLDPADVALVCEALRRAASTYDAGAEQDRLDTLHDQLDGLCP